MSRGINLYANETKLTRRLWIFFVHRMRCAMRVGNADTYVMRSSGDGWMNGTYDVSMRIILVSG